MFIRKMTFGCLASVALLAGCGSGSSTSSVAAAPVVAAKSLSFPVAAVLKDFAKQNSLNFTASGSVSASGATTTIGGSGTTLESTPTLTKFEGQDAYSRFVTTSGNLLVNGTSTPVSTTENQYLDISYNPKAIVTSTLYAVASAVFPLPATAGIGSSSSWVNMQTYANSSKSGTPGSIAYSWELAGETDTSAILKIKVFQSTATGSSMGTATTSYRVNADGSLLRLAMTADITGGSLSFTYNK